MRSVVLLVMSFVLGGAVLAESGAPAAKVTWFEGPVASAFEQAKKDGLPLFLYWGAVWCPPCNQIKKTIFSRPEFVEKMTRFVAVQLDGDTASAQTWGERLGVVGYPTMLVFDSAGNEILRLPTGLQLGAFLDLLDEALRVAMPISGVLERALAAPAETEVADADWRLLAFHSWEQDEAPGRARADLARDLHALECRIPARLAVERSRLFTAWLSSSLAGEDGEPAAERLPTEEVVRIDARLREILGERPLMLANLEFLESHAGDALRALYDGECAERSRLAASWKRAMKRVEEDDTLSVDERIMALVPSVELHELLASGSPFPEELQRQVRERAAWADRMAQDDYTRQAAMSTAGHLLESVRLVAEARALYEAQLEKSSSPHYFMSSLSGLAREAGKTDEAIEWLRRAYETAHGRATRFQWGAAYLLGLLDLASADEARIRNESLRVFRELVAFDDAFAGRNQIRVERLERAFAKWNESGSRGGSITAIREAMMPSCSAMPPESEVAASETPRARCNRFFGSLGS